MSDQGIARREATARFALAALLPGLASAHPLHAAPAPAPARPTLAAGRYILTRTLSRQVGQAATIVVTRSWRIAIAERAGQLIVSGRQLSASVDAPPYVAAIAAMEQARDTSGLFPIALDQSGLIAHTGEATMAPATLVRGIETSKLLFATLPKARAGEAGEARAFVDQLNAMSASAISHLPRDLFFPVPGRTSERREIPLPEGGEGAITVETRAEIAPRSGLLVSSSRDIVTLVDGLSRLASESWSLRHE